MYSNIKQGEHETPLTNQLDQCIKDLVERCQYQTEAEKMVHRTELLFHATKQFEVKKWVRSKKKREDMPHIKPSSNMPRNMRQQWKTSTDTNPMVELLHGNNHRWRSRHSSSGKAMSIRAKGGPGKTCRKCSMPYPLREHPTWGKKCHKCRNKKRFSTCCRSKQKAPWDSKRPPHGRSSMRCPKGRARWSRSRSRSRSNTQSAHSIELKSFQDHPQLHGRHSSNVHESQPNEPHGIHSFQDHEESTKFVKKTFHTIYRSKLV